MLIADDFGLGRAHDRVILELLEGGKIAATSVLINDAIVPGDIARLKSCRAAGAGVGLHVNLTQPLPGAGPVWPVRSLLRLGLAGRLPEAEITAALAGQFEAFGKLFGSPPDFVDGHQHCHVFPGISRLVARLSGSAWLRVPVPSTLAEALLNIRSGGLKTVLIMALGLHARGVFDRAGRETNSNFSGFLRLNKPDDVAFWLPRLLMTADRDCVVMVHPGDAADPVQCERHAPRSRALEAQLLADRTPERTTGK